MMRDERRCIFIRLVLEIEIPQIKIVLQVFVIETHTDFDNLQ